MTNPSASEIDYPLGTGESLVPTLVGSQQGLTSISSSPPAILFFIFRISLSVSELECSPDWEAIGVNTDRTPKGFTINRNANYCESPHL